MKVKLKIFSSSASKPIRQANCPSSLPQHIAIIMDGNGRWAKKRKLPRLAGHKQGVENITRIVEAAHNMGVKYMTLYTFSTENWQRPQDEVDSLMDLFDVSLNKKMTEIMEKNIRLNIIGDLSKIRETTKNHFLEAIEKTKNNKGIILTIALNYSGRDELKRAINKMLKNKVREVDEKIIAQYLDTSGLPDPELLVRTSGEMRISNFLLWQIAYTEVYLTDILWPDFRPEHLNEAIKNFQERERRFGGL